MISLIISIILLFREVLDNKYIIRSKDNLSTIIYYEFMLYFILFILFICIRSM